MVRNVHFIQFHAAKEKYFDISHWEMAAYA